MKKLLVVFMLVLGLVLSGCDGTETTTTTTVSTEQAKYEKLACSAFMDLLLGEAEGCKK